MNSARSSQKYIDELKASIETIKTRCDDLEEGHKILQRENKELLTKISFLCKNIEKIIQILRPKQEPTFRNDKFELKKHLPEIISDGHIKAFTKGKENKFALGTDQGLICTYSFDTCSQEIVFQKSTQLNREFLEKYPIDLYIPGCPVHPLTFINGVLDFISKK